jgi:hypothetical protein
MALKFQGTKCILDVVRGEKINERKSAPKIDSTEESSNTRNVYLQEKE